MKRSYNWNWNDQNPKNKWLSNFFLVVTLNYSLIHYPRGAGEQYFNKISVVIKKKKILYLQKYPSPNINMFYFLYIIFLPKQAQGHTMANFFNMFVISEIKRKLRAPEAKF